MSLVKEVTEGEAAFDSRFTEWPFSVSRNEGTGIRQHGVC